MSQTLCDKYSVFSVCSDAHKKLLALAKCGMTENKIAHARPLVDVKKVLFIRNIVLMRPFVFV